MDFDLSITNTALEHLDTFLPEITSLKILTYQQGTPPLSPFQASTDFKLFTAKEICKCHKLNDIWVNHLAAPLTKGHITYHELTLLMIASYEHDNPSHNCPNINKSHALISHSLIVLGYPVSNPRFRHKPCGFNPPFIYAFFMEAYMHFWDKIVNRILIHTGRNWLEEEGFINPFDEKNTYILARNAKIGTEVMNRVQKKRRRFQGITYICYRKQITIWSSYTQGSSYP